MIDDRLSRWLKDADAASPAPTMPTDLAERVLRRAQRRRLVRIGGWSTAVAAALVAAVGSALYLERGSSAGAPRAEVVHNTGGAKPDIAVLRLEIARLRIQADSRARVVEIMLDL